MRECQYTGQNVSLWVLVIKPGTEKVRHALTWKEPVSWREDKWPKRNNAAAVCWHLDPTLSQPQPLGGNCMWMMSLRSKQEESEAGNERKVEELQPPRIVLPMIFLLLPQSYTNLSWYNQTKQDTCDPTSLNLLQRC